MEIKYPEEEKQEEKQLPAKPEITPWSMAVVLKEALVEAKKRFDPYISQVEEMFNRAKGMMIDNDATNVQAAELGTSAMSLFNKIQETRHQVLYYDEAVTYVSTVNALAAMLTDKLYSTSKTIDAETGKKVPRQTIVSITKEKIAQYEAIREANRRKQVAIQEKARENLQNELDEQARQTGTVSPKVRKAFVSKEDPTIRTPTGTAYATHKWTFEVEDRGLPFFLMTKILSLITPEMGELYELAKRLDAIMPYLHPTAMYEDTRIRKAVHDGVRTIEGIKIYEDTGIRFTGVKK